MATLASKLTPTTSSQTGEPTKPEQKKPTSKRPPRKKGSKLRRNSSSETRLCLPPEKKGQDKKEEILLVDPKMPAVTAVRLDQQALTVTILRTADGNLECVFCGRTRSRKKESGMHSHIINKHLFFLIKARKPIKVEVENDVTSSSDDDESSGKGSCDDDVDSRDEEEKEEPKLSEESARSPKPSPIRHSPAQPGTSRKRERTPPASPSASSPGQSSTRSQSEKKRARKTDYTEWDKVNKTRPASALSSESEKEDTLQIHLA